MLGRILGTIVFSLICFYVYICFDKQEFPAHFDVLHILFHSKNVSVTPEGSQQQVNADSGYHHHGRHLLGHEDIIEEIPEPKLTYTIEGDGFPNNIDGGSILTYNLFLTHSVEREHTQCVVTFEADIPFSTLHNQSSGTMDVKFSSDLMEDFPDPDTSPEMIPINYTMEYLSELDKVRFTANISQLMWINLTEPWRRPDCWWAPSKDCYRTDYLDCIFFDDSPAQNWDPDYCYYIDITDCLPTNATSECFFVDTMECIERLNSTMEDRSSFLCPAGVRRTDCIQINDRGLFFADYNWTQPTLPPPVIPDDIVIKMCDMTAEEIWRQEKKINGTWFITTLFITPVDENGCRVIQMSPKPMPTGAPPTIDPFLGLPTTDKYKTAKDCLNVNTTGLYHPFVPTVYKTFNISVSFSGEILNTVEVNQKFTAEAKVNITQITKRPGDQVTEVLASVEYRVKKPVTTITATPTFSETNFALKHEQIDYRLLLKSSESQNGGMRLTISCKLINEEQKMNITTPEEEIVVVIGNRLIATTKINETFTGPVHWTNLTFVTRERQPPRYELRKVLSETAPFEPVFDKIEMEFSPFINLYNDKVDHTDNIKVEFSVRTLANVEPDDVVEAFAEAVYINAPNGDYKATNPAKLTVTKQPTIPQIPPAILGAHPDALDDIVYNFTLQHTLEVTLYDIWMEVTCPALVTVPDTMTMEFVYPPVEENTTTIIVEDTSQWDESFTRGPAYYIHLVELTPGTPFRGQQTFNLWDNSMEPHQEFQCVIELSYRRDWSSPIVLPYLAGASPILSLPQPTYELYGKDIPENSTMYTMPIGSHVVFIMNITFPELTTKMTVDIQLPETVLVLWYSTISHQGSNLELINSANTHLGTTTEDIIGDWDMNLRSSMLMNFGTVVNHADNKATFDGDNLLVEFSVILLDTPETVVRDTEHTLSTTVAYTNGDDMVQQQTIRVLEPGVQMIMYITNSSTIGDPGDVFQYKITLTHDPESQTSAYHILIDIHLQYMEVYADFLPNNNSRPIDRTEVFHEMGPEQTDEVFQLYLYKLELEEILEGTFLAKVSTKLTTGMALLATAEVDIYSFYRWGRLYEISLASLNVVNIRNATLEFVSTSEPATLERDLAIHEQATFKYRVPLPPIPTELVINVTLPRLETTRKKWLLDYMRTSVPSPLPIEDVFYEHECFGREEMLTDDCLCYRFKNLNVTVNLTAVMAEYSCEELDAVAGCNVSMAMTHLPAATVLPSPGYGGNETLTGAAGNTTSNFSTSSPPAAPTSQTDNLISNQTSANATDQTSRNATARGCPYWYHVCYQTTLANCQAVMPIFNLSSHNTSQNASACSNNSTGTLNSNGTSSNQTQSGNCTDILHAEANVMEPCEVLAVQACDAMLYRECSSHQTENNQNVTDNVICLCPMEAVTTESPRNATEAMQDPVRCAVLDSYNSCVNWTNSAATTAATSMTEATAPTAMGNTTAAPVLQVTEGPADEGPHECEVEETVILGMTAVVHTTVTSTRPGVVCSFIGGNQHDPISPRVLYHSPAVPTKSFRGGDEVAVFVTVVILDEPELVRGTYLEFNFTSTFMYERIPIPPLSMFKENCTCHENDLSIPELPLLDCNCPSTELYNATDIDCNCTEIVRPHEREARGFDCDCINLCQNNDDYFNALDREGLVGNLTAICNCASLNVVLWTGDQELQQHVQMCLSVHYKDFTCTEMLYLKNIDVEVCVNNTESICQPLLSCTCHNASATDQYNCTCSNLNPDDGLMHDIFNVQSCGCTESETYPRLCNCTVDGSLLTDRCVNETKQNCSLVPTPVEQIESETNCSCTRLNRDVAYNVTTDAQNITAENQSFSNTTVSPGPDVLTRYRKHHYLKCSCPDIETDFDEVEKSKCQLLPGQYQTTDCSCFVPVDNETQAILDNWDYNATIKDIAETSLSDHVIVVEPELAITFTRHPEPEIVDRLDEVKFDFDVRHTANSDSPAYNLTVTLDAVNFTRITGSGLLTPQDVVAGELCADLSHCNVTYNNDLGIFYLNFLPVDPPESSFTGTFTLIVKNYIDYVANSLITGTAILKYDSCSIDFPGRKYSPISDEDTVQIDAPTISSKMDKSTAYIYHIEELDGPLPKTFSIGDIVVVQAKLFMPEITLQMVNLSIASDLQDYTVNYGDAFLTDKISVRNDTDSFFLDAAGVGGEVYPPSPYVTAEFKSGGFTIQGGVVVSEANNTLSDADYITIRFAFRINNVDYWQNDMDIPFSMMSVYVSDYVRDLITLVDTELVLKVVEPKLSLRAEVLDHSWQLEQVTGTSSYTCDVNTCCQDEVCEEARVCITATDTMTECGTKECKCYSGFVENEEGGCTAVGRTAGDIIQYGLTITHDPEFTGNAFDVLVSLHSDLAADLLEGAHFFSRQMTDFTIMSLLAFPSLLQTSDHNFEVKIQRFNHPDTCERFKIPFRIRPEIETYPGMTWASQVTMSYYSSKVYGQTKHSRYYQIEKDVLFNFTAPAPSARIHMMIPTDSSGDIDFPVYSSSEPSHQVMVNLRNASQVKFEVELIIPKIICNVTVVMKLPKGNGFTFESVELTKLGSKIQFPHSKLSNSSITEDLDGNPYFYAELRGLYSVPDLLYYPRNFDESAKQKRFKTMRGEQRPYPTNPGCSRLNSTDHETYLLQGCFLDTTHYFEVVMATVDNPEHHNHTQNMTRRNCMGLCRADGYFYSGTKNGTECYCGNRTQLEFYHDNATIIYTPANQTVLESYTVTVYEDCNITYEDSTNKTLIEVCQDAAVYENCTRAEFDNCRNSTFAECFQLMTNSCGTVAASACEGSSDEGCIATETELCRGNASAACHTQATASCSQTVIEDCKHLAMETYRTRQLDFCRKTLYENCTQEMYRTCNETFSQVCSDRAMHMCTSPVTWECYRDEFENCSASTNINCTDVAAEACNNITSFGCQSETVSAYNSTVRECVTTELSNCSQCLNQSTHACLQSNSSGDCSTVANTECAPWCQFVGCADVIIEIAESYVYDNCSFVELFSFNTTYLGNCSREEVRWKNVTYVVNIPYYIQMSDCNVTCSGDHNTTCGGEDYITIYGPMYSTVVEQSCEWYTGLHQVDEDVLTLEITFSIDALSTKGVTEILHPYVSYDHGEDRVPTAIPFAPYLLEAGEVILDMTVSVSPKHKGFFPGDMLEYYTEVRHNPLSTVTARDIHVVWLFPYYVEFVELHNHKMAASKESCRDTLPMTALTTTPDESFKFYLSTLPNTDCLSFHFSVRIDPNGELAQGYYHLVSLAEVFYYSWDVHNPYEDDYKHNVLVHYHDIIPTTVKFEVPSTYTGRPELEDLKLSTYNILYDEQHNIMYACFFNNTMHVYEGGCFMVGVLPAYYTEVRHTCEDYCNCTFQENRPTHANCTDFDPKPENCSCGCAPDCYEWFDFCEFSCYSDCANCTADDIEACVTDCGRTLTNCSQECCIGDCTAVMDVCLFNCTNCTSPANCTAELNSTAVVDYNCTVGCYYLHGECSYECVREPNTCYDNCTDHALECSEHCDNVECSTSNWPGNAEAWQNCTQRCYRECSLGHINCSKECCFDECSSNFTLCTDDCLLCGDDWGCLDACNQTCHQLYANCSFDCDPVPKTCRENCTIDQASCQEECFPLCSVKTCEFVPVPNCVSKNITLNGTKCTTGDPHDGCGNMTAHCPPEEVCSWEDDAVCLTNCEDKCHAPFISCHDLCCVEDCGTERQACDFNCTQICWGDRLCLWQCRNNCTDLYDLCSHQCTFLDWICSSNCSEEYDSCLGSCPDQNVTHQNVTSMLNASLALSNSTLHNCSMNATQASNSSSNCISLNCYERCNVTYQSCRSDCPCSEPCSLQHKDCRSRCQGCENDCEAPCRGKCETSRGVCTDGCITEQSSLPSSCLDACEVELTASIATCAIDSANGTLSYADCVSASVDNGMQCSQSCYSDQGEEDCSRCDELIQNCSSTCQQEKCASNDTDCVQNCSANCTALTSQCFQKCDVIYPPSLDDCWNGCDEHLTTCLQPCSSCNGTNCDLAPCATTCVDEYGICAKACHHNFANITCSGQCTKTKEICLIDCRRDCSRCREHCHDNCDFEEDLCFMRCLPPVNCTEVNRQCVANCTACECATDCQSINCTATAAACVDRCTPAGVSSCQRNLTVCLHNCTASCASGNCTNCTSQCGLRYYQCMMSELQAPEEILATPTADTPSNLSATLQTPGNSSVNATMEEQLLNATTPSPPPDARNTTVNQTTIVLNTTTPLPQLQMVDDSGLPVFSNCSRGCHDVYSKCVTGDNKLHINSTKISSRNDSCSTGNCSSGGNITCAGGNCTTLSNRTCSVGNCTGTYSNDTRDVINCAEVLVSCNLECFTTSVPTIPNCLSECEISRYSCAQQCAQCTQDCQSCQYQCQVDLHNCTVLAGLLAGPTAATPTAASVSTQIPINVVCDAFDVCWDECDDDYSSCVSCTPSPSDCPTMSTCTMQMQSCRITCLQIHLDPNCTNVNCASVCWDRRRKRDVEPIYQQMLIEDNEDTRPFLYNLLDESTTKKIPNPNLLLLLKSDLRMLYISKRVQDPGRSVREQTQDFKETRELLVNYKLHSINIPDEITNSIRLNRDNVTNSALLFDSVANTEGTYRQETVDEDRNVVHHLGRRSVSNETVAHFVNQTSNLTQFYNGSIGQNQSVFCVGNEKYADYIRCLENCQTGYRSCLASCHGNVTCDVNVTSSNCSCGNHSDCVKGCSSNCTDVCEELRPLSHKICYQSCENVTWCPTNCENCSSHGNCSEDCISSCSLYGSNITVSNMLQCLSKCDQVAKFENCSSLCDGVPCPEGTRCLCDCECSNTTATATSTAYAANYTNMTAAQGNTTVNATAVNVTASAPEPIGEDCWCGCRCVEIAETPDRNYSQVFTHWRALDSNVGNLLGLEVSDNTLYALSHSGLAVMRSRDYGESWVSIHPDFWTQARESESYVESVTLRDEDLQLAPTDDNVFMSDVWNITWGVSGVGIHFSQENSTEWELIGTWKCCGDTSP